MLNSYDIRVGSEAQAKNSKTHSAGVTSLATGLPSENHFLTGSYDEHLRMFDRRAFNRPVKEINLQGGIWRIKLNPADPDLILCACMYNNFSIVRDGRESGFTLDCVLNHGDQKICYGADWGKAIGSLTPSNYYNFATCSFYDNLFSLNSYHCADK